MKTYGQNIYLKWLLYGRHTDIVSILNGRFMGKEYMQPCELTFSLSPSVGSVFSVRVFLRRYFAESAFLDLFSFLSIIFNFP